MNGSGGRRRAGEILLVGLIAACGLGLRLLGVGRGLPYIHEWDEWFVVPPVIKMLLFHTLNPGIFIYGSVYYYFLLPVFYAHTLYLAAHGVIKSIEDVVLVHPLIPGYGWYINIPSFYSWARAATAVAGAATIYVTYRLGRAAFGSTVGVLAAALLAVAPGAIYYADTVRVDVPEGLLTTAALLAGLGVLRRGRLRDYAAAGLLTGLAMSTKQTAVWLLVSLALAHVFNERRDARPGVSLGLMAAAIVAGGIIGTPYLLIRPDLIRTGFAAHTETYGLLTLPSLPDYLHKLDLNVAYLARPTQGGDWYVVPHAGIGLLPVVAAALGIAAGFARQPRVQGYLFAYPMLQLLFLARANVFYTRNLAPVLPVIAVWAALGAVAIWEEISAAVPVRRGIFRAAVAVAGIVVLLASPARQAVALATWLRGHEDTRTQAVRWLAAHVPRDATVAFELELAWFLPDLDRAPFHVEWTDRVTPPSWYAQKRVDYAAVSGWSLAGACPTVTQFPPPSYLPSIVEEAAFVPNSYPIIDPGVIIVRTRESCPSLGPGDPRPANAPALLLAP